MQRVGGRRAPGSRTGFNPHSAQGMNATWHTDEWRQASGLFQSSFSPRDECNQRHAVPALMALQFQSSFSPRDECNSAAMAAVAALIWFQSSFSPRDECNEAPRAVPIPLCWFQSSFSPRDECNPRWTPASTTWWSFNPHSAQGMNATGISQLVTAGTHLFQSSFSPRDECNPRPVVPRTRPWRVSILIQPKG